MHSATIAARDEDVYFINRDLKLAITMHWSKADVLARTTRLMALNRLHSDEEVLDYKMKIVRGDNLIMYMYNGSLLFEMTPEIAVQVANLITVKAREAEETTPAAAEQTILDGAVLFKLGLPFGLTDNPDMQHEIGKEAAWNSQIRKLGAPGIPSQEIFGVPRFRQTPPKEETSDGD